MASTSNLTLDERPNRHRHHSIVGPLILIAVGLLFLAQNLGLVSGDVWLSVWRLWPLLLILVGIDLVFGRTGWLGSIVVVAALLLVAGAVLWTTAVGPAPWWTNGEPWSVAGPMASDQLSAELGDARRAAVELHHGAGRLNVGALDADSGQLVQGDLQHSEQTSINRRVDRRGDLAEVYLSAEGARPWFGPDGSRQDWTIRLSPQVPTDLRVDSGASDVDLDLRDLSITKLNVQAGASSVKVVLPQSAGQTSARIQAGAAGIEVTVPEGVAARIHTSGGLGGTNVDQTRFPKVGDYYQSPDYNRATNRVELEVESGVSGVTVR